MSDYDMQSKLIEAMQEVAKSEIEKIKTTSNKVGHVTEDPKGFSCKVSINGNEIDCRLPEHLHSWIQKDDVVIIQDLYGDGSRKIVTGKTGSRNEDPSIVFHDEELGRNVSGVDIVFDEGNNNKINGAYGTVKG